MPVPSQLHSMHIHTRSATSATRPSSHRGFKHNLDCFAVNNDWWQRGVCQSKRVQADHRVRCSSSLRRRGLGKVCHPIICRNQAWHPRRRRRGLLDCLPLYSRRALFNSVQISASNATNRAFHNNVIGVATPPGPVRNPWRSTGYFVPSRPHILHRSACWVCDRTIATMQ
jgi:hypothetical protein